MACLFPQNVLVAESMHWKLHLPCFCTYMYTDNDTVHQYSLYLLDVLLNTSGDAAANPANCYFQGPPRPFKASITVIWIWPISARQNGPFLAIVGCFLSRTWLYSLVLDIRPLWIPVQKVYLWRVTVSKFSIRLSFGWDRMVKSLKLEDVETREWGQNIKSKTGNR